MNVQSWDIRFLNLAQFVSQWSKDPSTKVGAVIADQNNRIISIGYNGFPTGVQDDNRLEDRNIKYQIVVHAEVNAILFANTNIKNCTLYTYPFQPCSRCSGLIIQSGIKRVVAPINTSDRWKDDFRISKELLKEANIAQESIIHQLK